MKSRRHHILLFITIATLLGIWSCTDEALYRKDHLEDVPDNAIGFEVSSGFGAISKGTRSEDIDEEEADLEPILFSDGVDSLYIHRYVAPEIERATGSDPYSDTRSTPVNSINSFYDVNKEEGFKVVAMNTDNWPDSEYFGWSIAKPLSGSQEKWYVSPYKYWPGNNELCFNAYAPSSAEFNNSLTFGKDEATEEDVITFAYTVPKSEGHKSDATEQPDLMFATTKHSHYKSDGSHQGDLAPLNFRHALSSIKFAVGDVANITITDITIMGVSGSGKCVYFMNRNATDDNGNNDQNDGDDTDNTIFHWNDLSDPIDNYYCQTFNYENSDPYPDKPNENTSTVINNQNGYEDKTFMLIPQEIPETAILKVGIKYVKDDVVVEKTLKGKLKTDGIPTWEPGKEYIYTISTSSENWQYVFEVIGSDQTARNYDDTTGKYIDVFENDPDQIAIDGGVTEGSYYTVQSYRYRTNNPNKKEILPWTAVATEGKNTIPDGYQDYNIPNMTLERINWLLGENWKYESDGSTEPELFNNLEFAPQYVATDWKGDWEMRAKSEIGTKDYPKDLSMVYGKRNTANCYVLNTGGWYCIPLYYGCSIKDGEVDTSTFTDIANSFHYDGSGFSTGEDAWYYTLERFVDYKGNGISDSNAEIDRNNVKDAILVWQDASGIIDQYEYDRNNNRIVFHVDSTNIQQANCVLAVRDTEPKPNIIWSWHIWVTEHWVDNDLKLGVGDVECECWDENRGNFTIAPYNLGWCDPKNIDYLMRSGKITFTQTNGTKDKVLAKRTLDIIQRYKRIEYWIGNNTYYQFGRKDPMVGFINNKSEVKYNFGSLPYELNKSSEPVDIKEGILHPNVIYLDNRILFNGSYYNLWNNYRSTQILASGHITTVDPYVPSGNPNLYEDFAYSSNKTIYDPSPVGYVVPAVNLFKIFTNGFGNPNSNDLTSILNQRYPDPLTYFPGKIESIPYDGLHNYYAYSKKQHTENNPLVFFNVTGQRGYTNGAQWGSDAAYLWSNTPGFLARGFAYSFIVGYDGPTFWLNSHFQGTKTMARPVRCVKENNNHNGIWSSTNSNSD